MRRFVNSLIFSLLLIVFGFSGFASCKRKVFDPLEPINKTVPPNILVVVDNSGSMIEDTRNLFIYDHRTNYKMTYYKPSVGYYYHFNLNTQHSDSERFYVPPYNDSNHNNGFKYSTSPAQIPISTGSFVKVGEIQINDDSKVDYAGFAVDIWVPYYIYRHRDHAKVSIKLVHDGVSAQITPTNQWFAYKFKSYYTWGDPNHYQRKRINGRWYYRLRVHYAFPNFYGQKKSGKWKLYLKTAYTSRRLYFERFGLHFDIYVTKMTALKTVLQRIFADNPEVRFSLGTYRANPDSYKRYTWDGDGLLRKSTSWYVNSSNPGLSVWVDWPSDEMDTQSNRTDLLEWIDMKDANHDETVSGGIRKEIFARGYTPIQSCFRNIKSYLSIKYNQDTYQACRNYAVIFLTDGQCTESGCSNTAIRNYIKQIYDGHLIQVGTSTRGTKTYIIGLSLREHDREWLDTWADAGDDGNYNNHTGHAYLPQNSEELMQAFADAVHSASAQEVVISSDVIFGTINPNKAPTGSIFKANQFTTPSGHVYEGTYPAIEANIMFTTKVFYPSWEGDLIAYMPMYRSATDHKLYYFPQNYDSATGTYKPDYPVIWSARDVLAKRLDGYDDNGNHVPGIRDALGLTGNTVSSDDEINFRNILLAVPGGSGSDITNFDLIQVNQFVYDSSLGKYKPVSSLVNQIASTVYAGESDAVNKAKKFIEFVQARMLADITYSSPATIYEPEMGFEDWRDSYLNYKVVARHDRTPVVVVGANDGMLHAFNAYTGEEEWAFIPWGVIKSLKQMVANYDPQNNPSGQVDINDQDDLGRNMHLYGVASSPKVVDVASLDDDNPDNDQWNTILVCGLGGGGNSYFCLDVTDPTNPQIKWDTSVSHDFDDMGETWAYPSMWLAKLGDDYYNLGFFTSGYSLDSSKGKKLYVMDVREGQLLKVVDIASGNENFLFAAPAGILDADARFIKGVYVGDTEGELFRYDFLDDSLCEVFKTNNGYAIITLPAVYVDSSNNEWVSLGEFGCADVYSGTFANHAVLYTIKAFPTQTCNGHKNLIDITSVINSSNFNTSIPLGGHDGYYFNLKYNETMFADPLITTYFYEDSDTGTTQFETVSVFVTYEYPSSGDYCGKGTSYLYIFGVTDLFVGTRDESQNDYGSMVSKGRSGSPVKTGVSGTVWINTPDGPLRIMPLDNSAGSASIPVYSPFSVSCTDAKKVGAGSWMVY